MLKIKNLKKSYGKCEILAGIDISLPSRGLIMIIGDSGSGKTTLFNLLALLDKPDSGEIYYAYEPIGKYKEIERADYRKYDCSVIYQKYHLIDYLTVAENIALPLQIQDCKKDIKKYLIAFDLENKARRFPHELSGGERQRVALARSLTADTRVILADEPTGALDSKTARVIMTALKKEAENKLILVVTHDEQAAEKYGDKILTLENGKIVSERNKRIIPPRRIVKTPRKHRGIRWKYMINWTRKAVLKRKKKYTGSLFCYTLCLAGLTLVTALGTGLKAYGEELIRRKPDCDYLTVYTVENENLVPVDSRILDVLNSYKERIKTTYSYDYLLSQLTLAHVPEDFYYEVEVLDNIEKTYVNELFYKDNDYKRDRVFLKGTLRVSYLSEDAYEEITTDLSFPIGEVCYEGAIYNVAKIYIARKELEQALRDYDLPFIGEKLGRRINLYEYIAEYRDVNIETPLQIRAESEEVKAELYRELLDLEGVFPQYTTEKIGDNYSLIISGDEMLRNAFQDLVSSGEKALSLFLITLAASITNLIVLLLYYSLKEREKEYGVIRSYGGSIYDIFKLITLENAFFSGAAFCGAIGLVYVLKCLVYYYSDFILNDVYRFDLIRLNCSGILGTFLVLAVVFIFSSLSSISRCGKSNIVEVTQDD